MWPYKAQEFIHLRRSPSLLALREPPRGLLWLRKTGNSIVVVVLFRHHGGSGNFIAAYSLAATAQRTRTSLHEGRKECFMVFLLWCRCKGSLGMGAKPKPSKLCSAIDTSSMLPVYVGIVPSRSLQDTSRGRKCGFRIPASPLDCDKCN